MSWLLCTAASTGQVIPGLGTGRPNRQVAISAEFGWNDLAPAEKFVPIWITINPGSRTLEGTVSVTLPQDAVQQVRLVAPFAAAAGRATTIEFAASLPTSTSHVLVQVRDRAGRLVASQTWNQSPAGRQQMLPAGLFMYEDVVACVGVEGLSSAAKAWSQGLVPVPTRQNGYYSSSQEDGSSDLFEHVVALDILPQRLPTAWIAYDSLRCLVVDAGSTGSISAAATQAIRDWVVDGGRLVVIADKPGAQWITWLADVGVAPLAAVPTASEADGSSLAVVIDDGRAVAPPAALVQTVADAPRSEDLRSPALTPHRLAVRPITLTESGEALGWRTHWELAAEGSEGPGAAGTGRPRGPALLAEGPLGLGYVTVVVFDPSNAVLGVDRPAVAHLWKHVLAGAMEPFAPNQGRRENAQGWWGQQASGDHQHARYAVIMGLDHLADVRVPSGWTFYLIAGACVGLALLIGPVDAVILKKLRRRPLAWASALGWIALASLGSYLIPAVGEQDGGRLGRLNVIDQIHDRDGLPVLSRQTVLTGVFAGRAGSATLETSDPTAWWRGVSSVQSYTYGRPARTTAAPITLAVSDVPRPVGTTRGPRGAGGPVPGSMVRAAAPRSIPMAMYTFRTLMERGAGHLPLALRVSRHSSDSWQVLVAGVPEGGRVMEAELAVGSERYPIEFAVDTASGQHVGTAQREGDLGGRASEWRPETLGSQSATFPGSGSARVPGQVAAMPGQLLRLMGTDARTNALEHLLASGRWAVVYLRIENVPTDAFVSNAESSSRTVIARLAAPLKEWFPTARVRTRWTPSATVLTPTLPTPQTAGQAEVFPPPESGDQTAPVSPSEDQPGGSAPPEFDAPHNPARDPETPKGRASKTWILWRSAIVGGPTRIHVEPSAAVPQQPVAP